MEKVVKFSKTVRNNWKKSVLGVIALYYGASELKERYEINMLMAAACKEAAKYGDAEIQFDRNPTLVTVILNPVANKRKAKKEFEKYCEPLLHLAGLQVDVVQTASEGNAKEIVESLSGTEAIVVAGGDGTLSEIVTGLLRRNDDANLFPVGVLPLGNINSLGNTMFPGGKGVKKVKQLIEASMAIIKGETVWKDAMKIEPIVENDETPGKPIYAMSGFDWGAFRDTLAKKDKYWLFGSLREYASFVFNGYKDNLTWNCCGTIRYTPPCNGCTNCVKKKMQMKRTWSLFVPSAQVQEEPQIINPECTKQEELCFKTCSFEIKTPNIEPASTPALNIKIGKNKYTYTEFVSEGWRRLKNEEVDSKNIQARTIELVPKDVTGETMVQIDREEYDAKPVKITLLPKVVRLYCSPRINVH